jgi:hypothetical protein
MLRGPYGVISETIVADERPPSPSIQHTEVFSEGKATPEQPQKRLIWGLRKTRRRC